MHPRSNAVGDTFSSSRCLCLLSRSAKSAGNEGSIRNFIMNRLPRLLFDFLYLECVGRATLYPPQTKNTYTPTYLPTFLDYIDLHVFEFHAFQIQASSSTVGLCGESLSHPRPHSCGIRHEQRMNTSTSLACNREQPPPVTFAASSSSPWRLLS
jgi:hypothetical protein